MESCQAPPEPPRAVHSAGPAQDVRSRAARRPSIRRLSHELGWENVDEGLAP